MNKIEIQSLIERVIEKKDNLRTPAWWMRKLFNEVINWVEFLLNDLNKTLTKSINNVQSNIELSKQPYIIISGSGILNVDGKRVKIENADRQKIYYKEYLPSVRDSSPMNDSFTYLDLTHVDFSKSIFPTDYVPQGYYFLYNVSTLILGPNLDINKVTHLILSTRVPVEIIINGLYAPNLINIEIYNGTYGPTNLNLSGLYAPNLTNIRSSSNAIKYFNISGSFLPSLTSFPNSKSKNLVNVNFDNIIHSITNMQGAFSGCTSLTSLDLSSFDTSSVTDMSHMFGGCASLASLDLSSLNTSSVTNMTYMFGSCVSFTFIDLSSLDTSSVTSMSNMFNGCRSLTCIDISDLDTSSVTSMSNMFYGCTSLTSLNLSSFDTSSVRKMDEMFYKCSSLTSLDLSSFDTSSVTDMTRMFYGCTSLTSLNLSSFDTSSVIDIAEMFYNCENLSSLFLGPNFFKIYNNHSLDLTYCTKWVNETVQLSLVTNIYDRATNGLSTFTLNLSANTKAALSDEQKAYITSKGYTIA